MLRQAWVFTIVVLGAMSLTACGDTANGRCENTATTTEDRHWFWIYENAVIAQNRKCILCYLERPASEDRCFYIYNEDFFANRQEETCAQYSCSDNPGTGDPWREGHGGTNMITSVLNAYDSENPD